MVVFYKVRLESCFAGKSTNYEFIKKELRMNEEELEHTLQEENGIKMINNEMYCIVEYESIN